MTNKITITVEGCVGSGKTALCQLVQDTLSEHLVTVEKVPEVLSSATHFVERRSRRNLMKAIATLVNNGLVVDIVEKNIPR